MLFWVIMNTLIVVISSMYLIFYARVFEQFGLFVRMCKHTLVSMSNFLIFLIFWIIFFAYLFAIAGSPTNNDEDYKYVNHSM